MITKAQIDAAMAAFEAEPDTLPGATIRDQIAAAIVAAERAAWQPISEAPKGDMVLVGMSGGSVTMCELSEPGPMTETQKRQRAQLAKDEVWPDHRKWTPVVWRHVPKHMDDDDSVPFFS